MPIWTPQKSCPGTRRYPGISWISPGNGSPLQSPQARQADGTEATLGIEPRIRVLQTPALPLGYVAQQFRCQSMEIISATFAKSQAISSHRRPMQHTPTIIGRPIQDKPNSPIHTTLLDGFPIRVAPSPYITRFPNENRSRLPFDL